MGSYASSTYLLGNFQLGIGVNSYFAGSALETSGPDALTINSAFEQWVLYASTDTGNPAAEAQQQCSANNATNVPACQNAVVTIGTFVAYNNWDALLWFYGLFQGAQHAVFVPVMNNTPFNLSTSQNPSDEQCYINNKYELWTTGPQANIPPASPPTAYGCLYTFSSTILGEGPSGAFWVSITDPNDGTVIGGLCVAFSDPESGSNTFAVSFNQPLEPWFESFNGSGTNTPTAMLPAQTIGNTSYPALTVAASISGASGSLPMILVNLSTWLPPDGALVQVSGNAEVYLVILGQACWIPDSPTAQNLFGSGWDSYVQLITQDQLNSMPPGRALTSGACLIQASGQDAIYLYTWGNAFWIANPAVFISYGFNNGTVYPVPATVLQAIPQGVDINE